MSTPSRNSVVKIPTSILDDLSSKFLINLVSKFFHQISRKRKKNNKKLYFYNFFVYFFMRNQQIFSLLIVFLFFLLSFYVAYVAGGREK